MDTPRHTNLVRFMAPTGVLAGTGFLFTPRRILCSAGSVAAVLGYRSVPLELPSDELPVTLSDGQVLNARVIAWHSPQIDSAQDAAVLELPYAPMGVFSSETLCAMEDFPVSGLETVTYKVNHSGLQDSTHGVIISIEIVQDSEASQGMFAIQASDPIGGLSYPGSMGAPVWSGKQVIGIVNSLLIEGIRVFVCLPLEQFQPFFTELPVRLPGELRGPELKAPDLPLNFLPRPVEASLLRKALLTFGSSIPNRPGDLFGSTALSGLTGTGPIDALRSDRIVLHGNPGIGKTSLAVSVLRDIFLRKVYFDGMVWLNLGEKPDILKLQMEVAKAFGAEDQIFQDPLQGRRFLRTLLADRSCLIILDDVWLGEDARMFDCLGPHGMLLVIGRETGLVGALYAMNIQLGPLTDLDAETLLKKTSGYTGRTLSEGFRNVLAQCEGFPLALQLLGGVLRANPHLSSQIALQCAAVDIITLKGVPEAFAYAPIIKAMTIAVRYLPEDVRDRLNALAIFPSGIPIPVTALQGLWRSQGVDRSTAQDIILFLLERGFLQPDQRFKPELAVCFHDFLIAFLRLGNPGLKNWHVQFVQACGDVPYPTDGYVVQHIIHHMLLGGMIDQAHKLLLNFRFLTQRLAAGGLAGLFIDYRDALNTPGLSLWDRNSGSEGLFFIQTAIRQAAAVVCNSSERLAAQLTGRLKGIGDPDVNILLDSIRSDRQRKKLLPLNQALPWPGKHQLFNLLGHSGVIRSVIVTLDGQYTLSASEDHSIRVWNLLTGMQVASLKGHNGTVTCLAVVPDGRHVLSGGEDGDVILWRLTDFTIIQRLNDMNGLHGRVVAVSISADGRRAVVSYADRKILLWDLEFYRVMRTYSSGDSISEAVLILPGSLRAASAGRSIQIWDLETGQIMLMLSGHTGSVKSMVTSNDGLRLISASEDRTVRIWDLQTGEEQRIFSNHGGTVRAVLQLPGMHMIVSGGSDRVLHIWDIDSGRHVQSFEAHNGNVRSLAVTLDGRTLVSAGDDRQVCVWDQTNYRLLYSLKGPTTRNSAVILTSDGRRSISASADGAIRVWDMASGNQIDLLQPIGTNIYALALSPDQSMLFAGSADGTLMIFDPQKQFPPVSIAAHGRAIHAVAVTPDGKRVVTASADGSLLIWNILPSSNYDQQNRPLDLGTCELAATMYGHSSYVRGVACLPDNWRAVSVSADRTLKLWDLDTGTMIYSVTAHEGEINDVAYLGGGRLVVTASDDGLLKVWDVEKGHPQYRLIGHTGEVNAVATTPDRLRIVSVSNDRSVRVWDVPEKRAVRLGGDEDLLGLMVEPVLTLEDHSDWIHTVAVTGDGMRAVSASEDTTLKIWDISREGNASLRRQPVLLPHHSGGVSAMAVSQDGRFGLSAGFDGALQYWRFSRDKSGLIAKCEPKDRLPGNSKVTEIVFFQDGVHLAAAYADRTIKLWNLDRPAQPVRVFRGHPSQAQKITLTPDGRRLCSIGAAVNQNGRNEGVLRVWDVASGSLSMILGDLDSNILTTTALPGGRQIAGLLSDGRFVIWDIYAGRQNADIYLFDHQDEQEYLNAEFDPLSQRLVVVDGQRNGFSYDMTRIMLQILKGAAINPGDLSPIPLDGRLPDLSKLILVDQGRSLVSVSGSEMTLWDTDSGKQKAVYTGSAGLLACAGSKTGTIFLAGDQEGIIHILSYE